MQCESCHADILPTMKGALKTNTCPYCGGEIMEDAKAEQYFNLLGVLDQTTFTNRQDVDSKIRAKVASLIMSNFIFMKIDQPTHREDIIVVDDEAGKEHVALTKKPPRKKKKSKPKLQTKSITGRQMNTITEEDIDDSQVRSMPMPSPKPQPVQNTKTGLSARDYIQAQNDIYTEASDTGSMVGASSPGITAEEVMKMFPEMTPEQALEALKNDAQVLEGLAQPQKGLTGKGIRRLNQ